MQKKAIFIAKVLFLKGKLRILKHFKVPKFTINIVDLLIGISHKNITSERRSILLAVPRQTWALNG